MDLSVCQDKFDHCHVEEDGSLFCDLCNVNIEGTYEQHKLFPTHVCKRNAFLKLECPLFSPKTDSMK